MIRYMGLQVMVSEFSSYFQETLMKPVMEDLSIKIITINIQTQPKKNIMS